MIETITHEAWDKILLIRRANAVSAEGSFRVDGDRVVVDTAHPAFPKARHERVAELTPIALRLLQIDVDDPEMERRRAFCRPCPKNHGLTDVDVACDCRKCQAKSLRLWECPMGHFPALVDVTTPTPAPIAFGSNVGKARFKSTPAAEPVTFPIDLVYLWVGGSDPKWLASYKAATKKSTDGTRYTDAGELKYSLRSVDRFAPWINRVFVVTDQQRPEWLVSNPRVTIVDHAEIIDAKYLPVFNSQAIEPHIHKIPGLSEHLLFANDDTMFGAPLEPGHFFQPDGRAIVPMDGSTRTTEGGIYNAMRNRGADLLDGAFGKSPWELGWHQIKAYRRSMLADAAERFAAAVDECSTHKLRSSKDVAWNCALWPAFSVAAGYGVKATERLDDFYLNPNTSNARQRMAKAIKRMPHLMCINNGRAEDAAMIKEFLKAYFPAAAQPHA